ncbi:MAG: UvrD-helicase domain-containing protein, partial [Promethearchaeota archaeon]
MPRKIVIRKPVNSELAGKYKEVLNEGQYEAVTHTYGPALIIAGAGTGKT